MTLEAQYRTRYLACAEISVETFPSVSLEIYPKHGAGWGDFSIL